MDQPVTNSPKEYFSGTTRWQQVSIETDHYGHRDLIPTERGGSHFGKRHIPIAVDLE